MATVYDYKFYNTTRLGDDDCDMSQRNVQNSSAATYMLDNFKPACPMTNAIDFATSQPNVNYTGSHQVGINGCNIDENSSLLMSELLRPKCRISLLQRPFATVPFLGRGSVNPVTESQIQQGEQNINKKSVNNLGEKSYIKYHQTPLLPAIKQNMTDSTHKIESDASDGWIRGGVPSRELTRDGDYYNNHSKHQYI